MASVSMVMAMIACAATQAQGAAPVAFDLEKVDDVAPDSWVSSLWGHTAPKLVYDGAAFYTISIDGNAPAAARGAVYKRQDGAWSKGHTWPLDYQPSLLLLDDTGRLVIVYARASQPPVVLRSKSPGNIHAFDTVPIHPSIPWAGYMGAGMYGHKLILGYISHPDAYSFWVAMVDVETGEWTGPKLLAPFDAASTPQVSWLYPMICPRDDGIHIVVANNADENNLYSEIKYMKFDYGLEYAVEPKRIDSVPPPYGANFVFQDSFLASADGAVYVTTRRKEDGAEAAVIHRRDPATGTWTHRPLTDLGFASAVTALFEDQSHPGTIWLTCNGVSKFMLYNSQDGGTTWTPQPTADFTRCGLGANFMHGILQGSGSRLPAQPALVFTGPPSAPYSIWFLQWLTAGKDL